MTAQDDGLATLLAKEAIRELGMLYSRGVDRKDGPLLRTLYTADATDSHGDSFDGPADAYVDFLERSFPHLIYSGHHICNHLVSVEGETGEGEIYALAFHVFADGRGGFVEDLRIVRYLDRYRREADGRWRFAKRVVTYDYSTAKPVERPMVGASDFGEGDASYAALQSRLFARHQRP